MITPSPRLLLPLFLLLPLLLLLAPYAASAHDDGCLGDCSVTVADWPMTSEVEFAGLDPRAVEDAGMFLGMTTCNLLAARGMRTAAVEVFGSLSGGGDAGTAEAEITGRFVAAFRRHLDDGAIEPFEITLRRDPSEPLHLLTAAQTRERTGADLLVTCKYAGSSMRVREYRPDHPDLRMRRVERTGRATFRVMAIALTGALEGAEPALLDEVRGGFVVDSLFRTGTDEIETESATFRVYEHFPGLDPPEGPPEKATDPIRP